MTDEDRSIGDLMGEVKGMADELLVSSFPSIRTIADGWFKEQALKVQMLQHYRSLMDVEKVGFKSANRTMETTYPDTWKAEKLHIWECYDMGDSHE